MRCSALQPHFTAEGRHWGRMSASNRGSRRSGFNSGRTYQPVNDGQHAIETGGALGSVPQAIRSESNGVRRHFRVAENSV